MTCDTIIEFVFFIQMLYKSSTHFLRIFLELNSYLTYYKFINRMVRSSSTLCCIAKVLSVDKRFFSVLIILTCVYSFICVIQLCLRTMHGVLFV